MAAAPVRARVARAGLKLTGAAADTTYYTASYEQRRTTVPAKESQMESLILLACPVGMGLMMWFMMKGQKAGSTAGAPATPPSVEVLRAERDRIDAELRRHEPAERTHTALRS